MAKHGTPEPSTLKFGEEVARLRNNKKWSRTQLVSRVHWLLPDTDPLHEKISNDWLRSIEEGKTVKLTRRVIQLLAEALDASPNEIGKLFLLADRNPLADEHGSIDDTGCGLISWVQSLYDDPDIRPELDKLFKGQDFANVSAHDKMQILQTMVHTQQRSRQLTPPIAREVNISRMEDAS